MLTIANPGSMRVSVDDAVSGGFSDPRNTTLVKMFNLINVGDRAGTGLSTIYSVWKDEGWVEPVLEEQFNPDRTVLTLVLSTHTPKVAIKSGDNGTNVTDNVIENVSDKKRDVRQQKMLELLSVDGKKTTSKLAVELSVSERTILRDLESLRIKERIKRIGSDTSGYWQLLY